MSRWICVDDIGSMETRTDQEMIDSAPSIDIVRCKECKHIYTMDCAFYEVGDNVKPDDFCSYGEREGE